MNSNSLTPKNQAILTCVLAHGWADTDALHACAPNETRPHLYRRLRQLVATGWLLCDCSSATKCWSLTWRAHAALERLNAPAEEPNLVPPRRINVMAGHYQPSQWQTHRAGAQDHLSVPSLRGTQRVVHQGTYLFR